MEQKKNKGGRPPKFVYDSEDFLATVVEYAKRGYTDKEIAFAIGLNPSTFYEKKAEFPKLCEALLHARAMLNGLVRATFLKTALGGRIIKTTQYVMRKCECKGQDSNCPICNGSGWLTPEQNKVVTETELAPNLNAQNRWLMNYDEEWKELSLHSMDVSVDDKTIDKISVNVVYNKKEDVELQGEKR